jgi:hypothetical protein
MGNFSGFFVKSLPLDQEHLLDVRKIKVFIQLCTAPNAAGFNPAVIRWRDIDEIRFLPILEKQRDVVLERGMIAL